MSDYLSVPWVTPIMRDAYRRSLSEGRLLKEEVKNADMDPRHRPNFGPMHAESQTRFVFAMHE